MKKLVFIFTLCIHICNSCVKTEPITDPSFYFNLVVTNPARSLKLSIDIRPPHASNSNGMIYIHRTDDRTAILEYRERKVVRKNMLDTMPLSRADFEKFSELIRRSSVWEQEGSIGPRTDGNAYRITVKDSTRTHFFTIMGNTNDQPLQDLLSFCTEQFEKQYPVVPVLDESSEIDLNKYDHLSGDKDSIRIRIVKYGNKISVFQNTNPDTLSEEDYLSLWQILENNRIWELRDNLDFRSKYPLQYRVVLRRGLHSNAFVVFAPSKLADKQYFSVINCIETLKPSM